METTNELRERLISYIDAELSKRKPEIEVGKWYKCMDSKSLQFITEYNGNEKDGRNFGFDYAGYWMDEEERYFNSPNLRLATKSEISEALKTECLKRFKVGDAIQGGFGDYDKDGEILTKMEFGYDKETDSMFIDSSNICTAVYQKGKFATVIESKQTIESTTGNVLVFTKPIDNELLTKIKNLL